MSEHTHTGQKNRLTTKVEENRADGCGEEELCEEGEAGHSPWITRRASGSSSSSSRGSGRRSGAADILTGESRLAAALDGVKTNSTLHTQVHFKNGKEHKDYSTAATPAWLLG